MVESKESIDQIQLDSSLIVNLDWKAYYEEFRLLHGDNPIAFHGRLLFSDGWMYATDYRGPEYPPPKEPEKLKRLQIEYWKQRQAIVRAELHVLETHVKMLKEVQEVRSAPLQQARRYWDSEKERRVVERGPVNLAALYGRLDWLREDEKECNRHLAELEGDRR